jgi:hypothetical protein
LEPAADAVELGGADRLAGAVIVNMPKVPAPASRISMTSVIKPVRRLVTSAIAPTARGPAS